ncbi:uncharacterized protein TNCV_3531131 [Trichonephila clavipes]|uniref:Uncharacterized protein n=1 Tax=Trichonephila clavipes TaxID=2585209 RepID=A0A8X6SRJ8_TRICX|nr:uncharacterized protein TNCV_3531131 [Trichonephila clavipes]
MAYLAKGGRQDLLELAETLDISIQDNFKVLDIKDAILKSEGCDVDFTKECLNRIISDRKKLELRAERDMENQRIFELQKLQFTIDTSTTADSNMPNVYGHSVRGKAIFGSRAAIEFSFGEKERPAQRRSN